MILFGKATKLVVRLIQSQLHYPHKLYSINIKLVR
jgi:hypothetical protein